MWTFINIYTFLKFVNLYFAYHMYSFLERITVATYVKRHSSVVHISNTCCGIVIMQRVYFPASHSKLNINTIVVIVLCLFKASLWNTSVPHTKKHSHFLCTVAHDMLCFTRFCQIAENKIQIQHLHIETKLFRC